MIKELYVGDVVRLTDNSMYAMEYRDTLVTHISDSNYYHNNKYGYSSIFRHGSTAWHNINWEFVYSKRRKKIIDML